MAAPSSYRFLVFSSENCTVVPISPKSRDALRKRIEGGPGKAVIAPYYKHFCRRSFIPPPRLNYLVMA